ncbi:hypothetical protein FQN57_003942 [Myotisia sp. PD_48]|nr:hypothetical protein FQN57_003942 [Myotisia sp. PD_48]
MVIEISRMTKADIPGVVECVQKGFADDPYFQWVFDLTKFSKKRNNSSLRNRCLWGIKNGLFFVAKEIPSLDSSSTSVSSKESADQHIEDTSELDSSSSRPRIVGIAMWLPPHSGESWRYTMHDWILSVRQTLTNIRFRGHGGLRVNRYWIWKDAQSKVQKELWTDERGYYFCNVVSVLPELHGRGIGRKLVEAITQQADREGMKCYLESSKSTPNVAIYEKMGFKLVKNMQCAENGVVCKLYCMTREPQKTKESTN